MQEADAARAVADTESEARAEATRDAMEARRAIIRYLNGWLASGAMPAEIQPFAREARVILVENLVRLHTELGQCSEAEALIETLEPLSGADSAVLREAYAVAIDEVRACAPAPSDAEPENSVEPAAPSGEGGVDGEGGEVTDLGGPVASAPPDAAGPVEAPGGSPTPGARRSAPAVPVALVGIGAAIAAAGAAWNLALLDERADHRRLVDRCEGGDDCDFERIDALGGTLRPARVPIGAMVGGGLAVAGTGALLWALGDRASVVGVTAYALPGEVGLSLRVGGAVRGAALRRGPQ